MPIVLLPGVPTRTDCAYIMPNVITYSSLLTKAHTLDEGRAVLADMRNDGFTPDAHTYSSLLKLSSDVNDVEYLLATMETDKVIFNKFHWNVVQRMIGQNTSGAAQQLLTKLKRSG
jgi:hypothetical protein